MFQYYVSSCSPKDLCIDSVVELQLTFAPFSILIAAFYTQHSIVIVVTCCILSRTSPVSKVIYSSYKQFFHFITLFAFSQVQLSYE